MSAFSKHNNRMQLAWDASSIKSYQFCPRYYQMNNLEGWQGDSTDLAFGRLLASGFERFWKARLGGLSNEDAVIVAIKWAMAETYYEDTDAQWGGRFETMWKCEGTTKYKNAKGNAAKCPFSHKKVWFPGDAPDICVECGSNIRVERRYLPDHPNKNRYTLIRSLIWYGLRQPDDLEESYHPYTFPDGTKAIELSGRMPLPWKNVYGESYMLTWNFDYIGQYGDELFITDNKSTKKTLNDAYFATFSPDTQFDTYDMIATLAFPDLEIKGTMVEGIQVLVGGTEFGLHPYYKTEEMREEHFNDLEKWIRRAEADASTGYWPMNKRNCWLCPFKRVCSSPPSQREAILRADFRQEPRWDPLQQR